VPHHALVNNGAPFVNAFQMIFTGGAWAGKLVVALAVVSGIGALNGWTLRGEGHRARPLAALPGTFLG
jgi:basic amino acid/polyamine antiporter, APA family